MQPGRQRPRRKQRRSKRAQQLLTGPFTQQACSMGVAYLRMRSVLRLSRFTFLLDLNKGVACFTSFVKAVVDHCELPRRVRVIIPWTVVSIAIPAALLQCHDESELRLILVRVAVAQHTCGAQPHSNTAVA